MMRNIVLILVSTAVAGAAMLHAAPTPTPSAQKASTKNKTELKPSSKNVTAAAPLTAGWSLANGIWVHSDGYKYVNGQVIRTGNQTHKRVPKPPTKAQLDATTKKAPPSPKDPAAAKAAERERNLTPRPAPQTGTHL
ncbi:MAG: hypothetical protein V7609_771 [Verrucomicrobiota bacterium]